MMEHRIEGVGVVTHALSLLQPWLWCMTTGWVVNGQKILKCVENRSWAPPRWVIGKRIALHASKGVDTKDTWPSIKELSGGHEAPSANDPALNRGCIVATAVVHGFLIKNQMDLLGVVQGPNGDPVPITGNTPYTARARMTSPWFFGPVGWILTDFRDLKPVPVKGALGLWKIPETVKLEAA